MIGREFGIGLKSLGIVISNLGHTSPQNRKTKKDKYTVGTAAQKEIT